MINIKSKENQLVVTLDKYSKILLSVIAVCLVLIVTNLYFSPGTLHAVETVQDVNIKAINQEGYQTTAPLMIAAKRGYTETVQALIIHQANPNISINAHTPLMYASNNGYIDIVRILMDNGADVNPKPTCGEIDDCYYGTPLIYAAENGHAEIVKILIAHGADINAMAYDDVEGPRGTALMYAAGNGHREIIRILLEKGAKINETTYYGATALIWAAEAGHIQVVKDLLDKGADVNKESWDGTALKIAKEKGHNEIVELLVKVGAMKEGQE